MPWCKVSARCFLRQSRAARSRRQVANGVYLVNTAGVSKRSSTRSKNESAAQTLFEIPEAPSTTTRQRARRTKATKPASADHEPPTTPRRAVFIDVENTTAEGPLMEVLHGLAIDPKKEQVELTAVGNWRAVPPALARRLASLGAKLVHSAPARGVRDWSDLWIATAAGCWLGQARPGDVLEIVSNDRAFDAIGDLAAARGVTFRRLAHTRATAGGAGARSAAPAPGAGTRGSQPRKRGATPSPPGQVQPVAQAASAEEIVATIHRLTGGEPGRWVNLDVLERALKEQGFVRPPGSPRLVTRLRALKQVEVDAHGRARIRQDASP
jgi:hypothetical protein